MDINGKPLKVEGSCGRLGSLGEDSARRGGWESGKLRRPRTSFAL